MTKWNDLVDSIKGPSDWHRMITAGQRHWGVPLREWRQALAKAAPSSFNKGCLTRAETKQVRGLMAWLDQDHPIELWVGEAMFYGRSFAVKSGVLLPRTDTEWVVEMAIRVIRQGPWQTVLELGSGSGVIGLTIALECPTVQVIAWEVSKRAVSLTRRNHQRYPCENHHLRAGSFFGWQTGAPTVVGPHTIMVCNPPYIPTGEWAHLSPSVQQHDPRRALDGGKDGLAFYRRLIPMAHRYHAPLFAEIGWHQANDVTQLAHQHGLIASVYPDASGHDRMVLIHRSDQYIQI